MVPQRAGSPAVVPGLDRVELPAAVVGEAALHGRPRQPAEFGDLGLGEAVRREAQDFHPLLNLRTRVVEAVAVDPFEFGRRQVEQWHGILPRGDSRWRRLRESARDGKLRLNRERYTSTYLT